MENFIFDQLFRINEINPPMTDKARSKLDEVMTTIKQDLEIEPYSETFMEAYNAARRRYWDTK